MQSIKNFILENNQSDQKGQALVEYGFITSIFSVSVLLGLLVLGNQVSKFYSDKSAQLEHMEATVEAYYSTPEPGCSDPSLCGEAPDEEEEVEDEPSYIKINPGNKDDWEFCVVTPSGTYNRNTLADNPNFTYSGQASSLFFKPTAGGGDAIVNGQAYSLQSGSYYLFEGSLDIEVLSTNPGSMGSWVAALEADTNPTSGNGKNRPTSPCE
ncbi:MAG: hypothetical protein AB8G95_28385 [Anaerolineae bacterium]